MAKKIKYGPFVVRPFIRSGEATSKWQLDIPPKHSPNGKRGRRIFKTKIEAEQEAKRLNRQIQVQSQFARHRLVEIGLSLNEIMPEWFEHEAARVRTGKVRRITLETKSHRLKPILKFFGEADLARITEDQFVRYQEHRLEAGMKPATINTEIAKLRDVLRWAVKKCLLDNVPDVEALRVARTDKKLPTPEEVGRIVNMMPDDLKPLILLFAETGVRKGEALNLRWNDVDELAGTISISRRVGEWEAKTEASYRMIPISGALLEALRGLPKRGIHVFASRRKPNQPVTDFRKSLAKAVKKANVLRDGEPMNITPHLFRSFYVTWQTERGVPESIVQSLVGHSKGSSVTRRHYTHHSEQARLEAVFELGKVSQKRSG